LQLKSDAFQLVNRDTKHVTDTSKTVVFCVVAPELTQWRG
jgi:hypothetical protein